MRDAFAHDSRRARLLALLGVLAAIVLVRAEASQAALAVSAAGAGSEFESATLNGSQSAATAHACRGEGPCFYASLRVHGSGRLSSTAGTSGERVICPPQAIGGQTWGCTLPMEYNSGWFNWSFDQSPVITLTPQVVGTGSFLGYDGTCPDQVGDKCVLDANELSDLNYIVCVEAFFSSSPGTVVGECVEDPGEPPIGDPIHITKAGNGTGRVTSVPNGMNCGNVCNAVFPPSQEVTLHSNADPGSVLSQWTGPCTNPQPSPACVLTMPIGDPPRPPVNVTATYTLTGPPPPPPPPVRPPLNTVLFQKPAKTTRKRTATFAWGARREGEPFFNFKSQCRLNKQVWKACSAPKTYRALKPGRIHTVRIRVGYKTKPFKWDTTPVQYSWRIRR